ncbi:YdcF family protein [Weissella cibaria]|uniref:YdcF family protein n=1 Tax=Weissella cibaria TaxID=137591 RepID=UPI000BFFF3C6|nr:YdcF family protein [Weissella cibaria]
MKRQLLIGLGILFLVTSAIVCGAFADVRRHIGDKGSKDCEQIIVLGAGIEGTATHPYVSNTLKNRLEVAYKYVSNGTEIFLSGGGYYKEPKGMLPPEADVMKGYLIKQKKVNATKIHLERYSMNTNDNFNNLSKIMDVKKKTVIITSDYHMARSLKLAKKAGFSNIDGQSVKTNSNGYRLFKEAVKLIVADAS